MKRRSVLFAAAALAAMSLFGSAVQAGSISVISDSGNLGPYELTNLGISGGVSHLELDLTKASSESLDTINGNVVSGITAAFTAPVFLDVTGSAGTYSISLTGGTYTKTFTDAAGTSAELSWNLTSGTTSGASFFNLTGSVTSVISDGLAGYTFAPFESGTGLNDITLVARQFGGGVSSFDTLISTPGGTAMAIGNGSFSESTAIPEPVSIALLGIGLSGLLTFRRFFKRTFVA